MNRDSLPGPLARHPAIVLLLAGLGMFFLYDWSPFRGTDAAAVSKSSPSSSSVDLSTLIHSEELPHR